MPSSILYLNRLAGGRMSSGSFSGVSCRQMAAFLSLPLLTLIVIAGSDLFPIRASAQEPVPAIKELHISIMPEYDDPRVLFVFEGEFEDKKKFPRSVKFYTHKGADMGMTCSLDESGTHTMSLYKMKDEGDLRELTFELKHPRFHFEYYLGFTSVESDRKEIELALPASYPIRQVTIEALEPPNSEGFTLPGAIINQAESGLRYHQKRLQDVKAQEKMTANVIYTRSDRSLVAKKEGTGEEDAPKRDSSSNLVLVLVVALSGMFLALSIYFFSESRQKGRSDRGLVADLRSSSQATLSGPSQTPQSQAPQRNAAGQPARYCSMCGTKVLPQDCFCASCGVQLLPR